ncbi:Sds3-like-domain-containing protein [Syncephalis plumigaleata]|nr:Sds3-like-domain-containing protein [Syncephalis plumigaleata]
MVGDTVRGVPVDMMDGISDDDTGRSENKRDRRRRMIHESLTRIYTTFIENKEGIYHDKSLQYKTELRKLLDGTHDEFQEKLSELARQRDESIECAELLRDYQLQTAEQLYAIESEQAENEYQKDLDELRDRLLQDLEERRRKLREEKDAMDVNVDLPYDAYGMSSTRAHNTRALRKKGQTRGAPTEQKAKRGPRPQLTPLNFGASTSDIEDDMLAIQRGTGSKKSKSRRV